MEMGERIGGLLSVLSRERRDSKKSVVRLVKEEGRNAES
jgi:hypothetical protein